MVHFSRKQQRDCHPLVISGAEVEKWSPSNTWSVHPMEPVMDSTHLHCSEEGQTVSLPLQVAQTLQVPAQGVGNSYTCIIKSILCGSITACMGNGSHEKEFLRKGLLVPKMDGVLRTTLPNL